MNIKNNKFNPARRENRGPDRISARCIVSVCEFLRALSKENTPRIPIDSVVHVRT